MNTAGILVLTFYIVVPLALLMAVREIQRAEANGDFTDPNPPTPGA